MSKTKIITDSASDLSLDICEKYSIGVVPLKVIIDGKEYIESYEIKPFEFYEKMATAKQLPTSSQANSYDFLKEYEKAYDQNCYSDAVVVTINSTGSGTYARAVDARNMFYENHEEAKGNFNIHVIDSKNYSVSYGYIVIEIAKMAQKDVPVNEILDFLDDWFSCVEVYFCPFTFEFIKKSGRVNCATAFVGEKLGIRPILQIIDGTVSTFAKVRGTKKVPYKLVDIAKERMQKDSPYVYLDGVDTEVTLNCENLFTQEFGYRSSEILKVGPAIVINCGPKMIGVAFKGKKRK